MQPEKAKDSWSTTPSVQPGKAAPKPAAKPAPKNDISDDEKLD